MEDCSEIAYKLSANAQLQDTIVEKLPTISEIMDGSWNSSGVHFVSIFAMFCWLWMGNGSSDVHFASIFAMFCWLWMGSAHPKRYLQHDNFDIGVVT